MRTFTVRARGDDVELDACNACLLVWFDDLEVERLGVEFDERSEQASRRAVADLHVQTLADSQRVRENRDAFLVVVELLRELLL